MKIIKFSILAFIFFIQSNSLFSENRRYDDELWSEVEIELPISKDVDFSLSQQFRFDNDVTKFKASLTDLGLALRFDKSFKLSGTYRLKRVPDEIYNEYHLNGYFSQKILSDIEFNFRSRFQARIPRGNDNEYYIRLRPYINLEVSDVFSPYFGVEYYYRFLYDEGDRFNKSRFFLGTDIAISKSYSMKIYYMLQREFNEKKPQTSNIAGISFKYEI